ncbi:MAG: DUF4145 domain-containing protein [Sulfuricella sp.]|nr:DUF4145 domain-containing protein [Sulfuricella sp.]
MTTHFEPPELDKNAFTCPHCGAFAAMYWENLYTRGGAWKPILTASCHRCKKDSVWLNEQDFGSQFMIFPKAANAPMPNEDLPDECMKDYLEARSILEASPRGAAALLRLCVQKLAIHLGGSGKNINEDIALLVKNGLPPRAQQALDVVRVVGNNAVHPGEMSVEDQPQTAQALFGLVNLIVDNQISQPRQVLSLFDSLPDGAKSAIEKRDGDA